MKTETMDTVIAASLKTTIGGSGVGAAGFMAHINWLGVAGLLIGAAGLAVNIYYQRKRDAREEADREERKREHALRIDPNNEKSIIRYRRGED